MEKDNEMIKIQTNINDEQIKKIAKRLLEEIGMQTHILGFKYWLEALSLVMNDKQEKIVMKSIYCSVAKEYKTTATSIEKTMRYTYKKINLNQVFNTEYPINNKALLFLLIDRISKEMDNT